MSIDATKPLASYSTDSRFELFTTALGLGNVNKALVPCRDFSNASSTRRGRTLAGTTTLIETPCTSFGRLKLRILALAATELGITAMLPWPVIR
ncbi:hypothetical protein D3C85_1429600 [compost metagenome]